jgi:hypothetical protein
MKANLSVKFTNILDRIQLYFDSLARSCSIGRIDLSRIGIHRNIFTHTSHPPVVAELKPNAATVNPSERENTGNRQLQKHQFDRVAFASRTRRHHSLNWRWQSQLIQWL